MQFTLQLARQGRGKTQAAAFDTGQQFDRAMDSGTVLLGRVIDRGRDGAAIWEALAARVAAVD